MREWFPIGHYHRCCHLRPVGVCKLAETSQKTALDAKYNLEVAKDVEQQRMLFVKLFRDITAAFDSPLGLWLEGHKKFGKCV